MIFLQQEQKISVNTASGYVPVTAKPEDLNTYLTFTGAEGTYLTLNHKTTGKPDDYTVTVKNDDETYTLKPDEAFTNGVPIL